jgi:hypothetical protein
MTPDQKPTESAKAVLERRPHAPVLKLQLTPEMVAAAEQRSSSHCMWAEAIKAAAPWASKVSVDLQTCRLTDAAKGLRYIYLTPPKAQVGLVMFDAGQHTDPNTKVTLRDGQVTKAAMHARRTRKTADMPRRRELLTGPEGKQADTRVVGGHPPLMGALPNANYRGKRRAFGLRLLIP